MFRTFRGGIRFDIQNDEARKMPIKQFDDCSVLSISMCQGGGVCLPTVAKGDRVLRGQMIGATVVEEGLNVYSPISGRVNDIITAKHPFVDHSEYIIIEADGTDQSMTVIEPCNKANLTSDDIIYIAHIASIPGPIQYSDPEYVRMLKMRSVGVKTVVCGAVECEPYEGRNVRICAEYANDVIEGMQLMLRAANAQKGFIALTYGNDEAERAINKAISVKRRAGEKCDIHIAHVPNKYPAAGKLNKMFGTHGLKFSESPLNAGVTSPFACMSLARAVNTGMPVTDVFVTVSGSAIKRPNVYRAPIGASMETLIRRAVVQDEFKSIILGGVMNGIALDGRDYSLLRCNTSVLAMEKTTVFSRNSECIHCNRCGKVCPEGLSPSQISEYLLQNDLEEAETLGLADCRLCGCCTYVCPGRMELTEILKQGKNRLKDR